MFILGANHIYQKVVGEQLVVMSNPYPPCDLYWTMKAIRIACYCGIILLIAERWGWLSEVFCGALFFIVDGWLIDPRKCP